MKKLLIAIALFTPARFAAAPTPRQVEFFEKKIRPIFVNNCYGCHSADTKVSGNLRVDDSTEPIVEMGRLVAIALVNDLWNRGWTAFTEHRYEEARGYQERAAEMAEKQPAVLPEVLYDLAVIRLAAGDKEKAQSALDRALQLNPKLKQQADKDKDLAGLK